MMAPQNPARRQRNTRPARLARRVIPLVLACATFAHAQRPAADSPTRAAVAAGAASAAAPVVPGAPAPYAPSATGPAAGLPPVPTTASTGVTGPHTVSVPFKQLGADQPFQLRGIDGTNGVPFSIRADEVVTAAKLKLRYAYSPALIPQLSHINVMLNGEVASTIPVPKETAGTNLERDIPLEPRLISEFNRLNLQLIGHYTTECEDPFHSSLWATISNTSVLELTVTPVALANELSLLPLPFFDRRDVRRLELPFVFAGSPAPASLEAAGAVSSWFGRLAGYRGATFPVSLNQVPASGNAVVFITSQERPAGIGTPPIDGPTVAIVPNPSDPNAKLLLVMGRDSAELKTAARALTLGNRALSGARATITQLADVAPRKPYDAPAWLRGDRPVRFGELAQVSDLNVSGYYPDLVRVNFRVPPDLFGWRAAGIPVDLRYRYTPRPVVDKSTLNVNVNRQFLHAYPLPATKDQFGKVTELVKRVLPDGTAAAHERITLPLFMLPAQSQLQLHYYYDYLKQGACKDVMVDNVRGAIDPDSTIDISGLPHFIALPDLAAFGNSGFPFTRMADLSESAVVLPTQPTAEDYSTYLTLVGRMGEQTGYPATGVTVVTGAEAQRVADRDLLVIGTAQNQPVLQQWAEHMPMSLGADGKRFTLTEVFSSVVDWWNGAEVPRSRPVEANLSVNSPGTDAALAGFESPLSSGRSVVVVTSGTAGNMKAVTEALLDPERLARVQGSLVLMRGKTVDSLAAQQTYYAGRLPPWTYMQWWLSTRPYMMVVMIGAATLLLGAVSYLSLRSLANRRKAGKA